MTNDRRDATLGPVERAQRAPSGVLDTSVAQEFSLALAHDPSDIAPAVLIAADDMLFLPAEDGVDGEWRSMSGATQRSAGPGPDIPASGGMDARARVGRKLVFATDDGVDGVALWTSDGTQASTRRIGPIRPSGDHTNGRSRTNGRSDTGEASLSEQVRARAEAAHRVSETKYRSLFESIDEGFSIIRVLFDERGEPIDYVFLETNPAFERQTGLRDADGKSMRALSPGHEEHWFETYGRIARTGEPERFESHAARLGCWYEVYAWRYGDPELGQVAVLFNDISARKRVEAELRDALAAKDQFLGFISHELSTPMTVILGMSRILAQRLADGEEQEMAADVASCAEELNDLIDSLLLLVRMEGVGGGDMDTPCHVGHTVERVLARQREHDPHREYRWRPEVASPVVGGTEAWLERVLFNLVGNAAKYSPPGRPVTVVLDDGEGELRVRVLDEGDGLRASEVEHLFEPFFRGSAHAGRVPGAGLGLTVCKRIVESMGGRIWASPRPGGGAEFGFAMPSLAEEEPPEAPDA
jgi:PAS domain S-box-containing protein